MPGILSSDFSNPNETLSLDKATIQIVDLGGTKVFKGILEPGCCLLYTSDAADE